MRSQRRKELPKKNKQFWKEERGEREIEESANRIIKEENYGEVQELLRYLYWWNQQAWRPFSNLRKAEELE